MFFAQQNPLQRFSPAMAAFIAVWVIVLMRTSAATTVVKENSYVRVTRCPGRELAPSHRYKTVGAKSVLDCAGRCRPDSGCVSAVFQKDTRQCHLGNATAAADCSNTVTAAAGLEHIELVDPCTKYGETLLPQGVCGCAKGFRGTPCVPYIGDCTEGFASGNFTANSTYYIHPFNAPQPFKVMCRTMLGSVRTYIMDRRTTAQSFEKNFLSYRNGFGNLSEDHWLGLEKMYQLTTSKAYELRVMVKTHNNSNYFQQYLYFVVTDSDSGYTLQFNSTVPDTLLGDCLTPLRGAKFSTFDQDNDGSTGVNCAATRAGGFWFRGSSCATCNPTGPLMLPTGELRYGVDNEAFWTVSLGNLAPFRISMFLLAI